MIIFKTQLGIHFILMCVCINMHVLMYIKLLRYSYVIDNNLLKVVRKVTERHRS